MAGYLENGYSFHELMTIQFSQGNVMVLVTKSSILGEGDMNELGELWDVASKALTSGSIDDTVNTLKLKGYSEHKINDNLGEIWEKLNSTRRQ